MADDDWDGLRADLADEHADLDGVVSHLDDAAWDTPTPAEGWAVRDQIGHLAFFDGTARTAVIDPDAFRAELDQVTHAPDEYLGQAVRKARSLSGADVLDWWRDRRAGLLDALIPLDPSARLPWYGPPMGARSFVTARLMETWAHGQDVADGLGVTRRPTDRLRHIAHLGVRTRGWSYVARGLEPPDVPVRVELTAPSGGTWSWGEDAAADRVTGDALDFCLVVTQRRHVDDTALSVEGDAAHDWIAIAQAFAGGATTTPPGRAGS